MLTPKNSLLIYDGDCGFCNASLIFAFEKLKIMPAAKPYQSCNYESFGLSLEEVENAIYLCNSEDETMFRGHLAISQILSWQTEKRYRLLGLLMRFPILSSLFGVGYYLVAKYRRFLPGGTPSCGIREAKDN